MSYLRYVCLFVYNGVHHILCFVFLRLVHPILPCSLDCSFLIASLIFSNVNKIESVCVLCAKEVLKTLSILASIADSKTHTHTMNTLHKSYTIIDVCPG